MRNLLVVGLCFLVVSCIYPPRPAGISREAIPLVFELSSRFYGEENSWIELRDDRITPHTFRGFYMKVKPPGSGGDMKAEFTSIELIPAITVRVREGVVAFIDPERKLLASAAVQSVYKKNIQVQLVVFVSPE
ncbi:MAG: hypothetical protein F4X75_27220 [Gemmatimonadetes bacterium]|nr:hypothetical protein [Gemmatimonadota bacterium]